MNTLKRRLLPFKVLATLVVVLWLAPHALAGQEGLRLVAGVVDERLQLEALIAEAGAGKNDNDLRAYLRDTAKPGVLRARALDEIFRGLEPPLVKEHVALLGDILGDASPQVYRTAIRLVGEKSEESLVKEVLAFLERDVDWRIKVDALKATRRWTRLSHMIFLQKALTSESQNVLAEAVRSISRLRVHELSPQVGGEIAVFLEPKYLPHLRSAALSALKRWDRVDWNMLQALILDETASESLRAYAIDMTDDIAEAVRMRPPVLLEIMTTESSLLLLWRSFTRLRSIAQNEPDFIGGVADFLAATRQYNVATQSMAAFLRNNSMVVKYVSGAWVVKRRQRQRQ